MQNTIRTDLLKGTAVLQCLMLTTILAASPVVSAFTASGGFSMGLEHTDNVRLVPVNEEDDQIVTTQLSGNIKEDSGPLTGEATASISNLNYLGDTFGEENYFRLGSQLKWIQIKDRLVWDVSDYFDQREIDSLGTSTPNNTESVNAFSIGAGLTLPVADRHVIGITPSFQDFYYDSTDADNQQFGLAAAWSYQLRPTISVSLGGDVRDVQYDDQVANSDYQARRINAGINVTRSRYDYSISAGQTDIKRDMFNDTDGFNAKISLHVDISGRSELVAIISTDLTDTSAAFLTSASDPNTGTFGNVQTSGDVLRNETLRVTYLRKDVNTNLRVWAELDELDYEVEMNDREVQEVGASLRRQMTGRVSWNLDGRFTRTEVTDFPRTDKTYRLSAGLAYSLSRRIGVNVRLEHNTRDSTDPANEYDELSVFAGVGVKFGN